MPQRNQLRALRVALGLTQEGLALRAHISRVEVVGLEGGRYAGRSVRMRDGLAGAVGIEPADMARFLAGGLSLAEVLALRDEKSKAEVA